MVKYDPAKRLRFCYEHGITPSNEDWIAVKRKHCICDDNFLVDEESPWLDDGNDEDDYISW